MVLQCTCGIKASSGADCQQRGDKIFRLMRYWCPVFVMKLILPPSDFPEEFSLIFFNERWIPSQEDVDNHAQTPHICLGAIRDALQNFWCYISWSTTLRFKWCIRSYSLGKPKVGNLYFRIIRSALPKEKKKSEISFRGKYIVHVTCNSCLMNVTSLTYHKQ